MILFVISWNWNTCIIQWKISFAFRSWNIDINILITNSRSRRLKPRIIPRKPPISATKEKEYFKLVLNMRQKDLNFVVLHVENKDFVTVSTDNSTSVGKIICTVGFSWLCNFCWYLNLNWVLTFIFVHGFSHWEKVSYLRSRYIAAALALLFGLHIPYFPLNTF